MADREGCESQGQAYRVPSSSPAQQSLGIAGMKQIFTEHINYFTPKEKMQVFIKECCTLFLKSTLRVKLTVSGNIFHNILTDYMFP